MTYATHLRISTAEEEAEYIREEDRNAVVQNPTNRKWTVKKGTSEKNYLEDSEGQKIEVGDILVTLQIQLRKGVVSKEVRWWVANQQGSPYKPLRSITANRLALKRITQIKETKDFPYFYFIYQAFMPPKLLTASPEGSITPPALPKRSTYPAIYPAERAIEIRKQRNLAGHCFLNNVLLVFKNSRDNKSFTVPRGYCLFADRKPSQSELPAADPLPAMPAPPPLPESPLPFFSTENPTSWQCAEEESEIVLIEKETGTALRAGDIAAVTFGKMDYMLKINESYTPVALSLVGEIAEEGTFTFAPLEPEIKGKVKAEEGGTLAFSSKYPLRFQMRDKFKVQSGSIRFVFPANTLLSTPIYKNRNQKTRVALRVPKGVQIKYTPGASKKRGVEETSSSSKRVKS